MLRLRSCLINRKVNVRTAHTRHNQQSRYYGCKKWLFKFVKFYFDISKKKHLKNYDKNDTQLALNKSYIPLGKPLDGRLDNEVVIIWSISIKWRIYLFCFTQRVPNILNYLAVPNILAFYPSIVP